MEYESSSKTRMLTMSVDVPECVRLWNPPPPSHLGLCLPSSLPRVPTADTGSREDRALKPAAIWYCNLVLLKHALLCDNPLHAALAFALSNVYSCLTAFARINDAHVTCMRYTHIGTNGSTGGGRGHAQRVRARWFGVVQVGRSYCIEGSRCFINYEDWCLESHPECRETTCTVKMSCRSWMCTLYG